MLTGIPIVPAMPQPQHQGPAGLSRQDAIQNELGMLGYTMEHGLMVLEGDEGHPIIEIATGEMVDPPDEHVLKLAEEWSMLEGATHN